MPMMYLEERGEEVEYYPDDIFCAMIYYADLKRMTTDTKKVHSAIFQLKGEEKYADLLKRFAFSTSGTFNFSKTLEKVILRLETARILGTSNPDYPDFEIKPNSTAFIEERIINRIIKEKDKPIIEELAHNFAERIK